MESQNTIKTGYEPRTPQKQIHQLVKNNRFSVVVAHRRMGKTVCAINQLIHSALISDKPNPRFAYIAPTYNQAKRVAWDYLLEYTRPLGGKANIAELRVDFMGRRISLYGADNPDSLRGIYLDGVVIDEIGDVNPSLFTEILRPALADRQGYAVAMGTPKGQNHFKDLRDRGEKNEGWSLLEFKASETGLLLKEELKAAFDEMGEDKYMQEFECSFQAPVEGSYYSKIIHDLEQKNRITEIERDGLARTYTGWDLGMSDSTAIWVAQLVNKEVRLVDYVENHGVGLDYYVSWLQEHDWMYATHILPHDVVVRELGTGKSRKEMLEDAGLAVTVAPKLNVADGIQASRRLLPRCWFDPETTKQGLDALRNYRRVFDEKRNVFHDRPLHDWSSHASDAFRYLAVGLDESPMESWHKPIQINNKWIV
jgi:phage terminase large subunit